MPWHPAEAMLGWEGFYKLDISKALGSGLSFRPLAETIRDTSLWDEARGTKPLKLGLTPEREAALLNERRTLRS